MTNLNHFCHSNLFKDEKRSFFVVTTLVTIIGSYLLNINHCSSLKPLLRENIQLMPVKRKLALKKPQEKRPASTVTYLISHTQQYQCVYNRFVKNSILKCEKSTTGKKKKMCKTRKRSYLEMFV